ncbi:[similarity to] N-acetylglucosamine-6-phosphate deacetylase, partial [methanotrophic bacterial endosymbiont of Bathymodiolus sp.]
KQNPNLLAGSVQMLPWSIGQLVQRGLAPLSEAWEMASIRPSSFMGLPTHEGIKVGAPADLVVFNWERHRIETLATYKLGQKVY